MKGSRSAMWASRSAHQVTVGPWGQRPGSRCWQGRRERQQILGDTREAGTTELADLWNGRLPERRNCLGFLPFAIYQDRETAEEEAAEAGGRGEGGKKRCFPA